MGEPSSISYDTGNLRIVDEGDSGWLLTDGRSRMAVLDNSVDAEAALALARRHTDQCFIGRDNTRPDRLQYIVEYWEGTPGNDEVVSCEQGQLLAEALENAKPGTTLRVSGTCNESVFVFVDGLTIDGGGTTTIAGTGEGNAVIEIDGSFNVTIRNVTVAGGNDGIRIRGGATVILENITAEGNDDNGFEIDERATVQCIDCIASNNGNNGFFVLNRSLTNFHGRTIGSDNQGSGIKILDHAEALFRTTGGVTVLNVHRASHQRQINNTGCLTETVGNGEHGTLISAGSHLFIGENCVFNSQENGRGGNGDGILVTGISSSEIFKAQVMSSNNLDSGIVVRDASIININGSIVTTTLNGLDGIKVEGLSDVEIDYGVVGLNDISVVCSTNNNNFGFSLFELSGVICKEGTALSLGPNGQTEPHVVGDSLFECVVTVPSNACPTPAITENLAVILR
jgi:hypothetical protein